MLTFSNYEFYHIDHDSERIKVKEYSLEVYRVNA